MASKTPRKVIKVLPSGVPEIFPDVEVTEQLLFHVEQDHEEEFSRFEDVQTTVADPTWIYQSKTQPKSVVLIKDGFASTSGDPLRVAIKRANLDGTPIVGEDGTAVSIMTSAHYSSSKDQGDLIWTKPDEQ